MQITLVPKLESSNVLEAYMSIISQLKSQSLPWDLREMWSDGDFNFTFLSYSISNLGNDHNMTDGFLMGFGHKIFN